MGWSLVCLFWSFACSALSGMGCRTPQLPLSASFQLDSINTGVAENGRVGGREQPIALAAASPGLRASSLTDPPTRWVWDHGHALWSHCFPPSFSDLTMRHYLAKDVRKPLGNAFLLFCNTLQNCFSAFLLWNQAQALLSFSALLSCV